MSTPWQCNNCFKSWYRTLAVGNLQQGEGGREFEGKGGRDGELSDRQSENSGRSSFHPFVCSQAVFSPVKTKFNLHPFTHCFSLPPPRHPALFDETIVCFHRPSNLTLPLLFLSSFSRLRQSHRRRAHKRLSSILLASGVVV